MDFRFTPAQETLKREFEDFLREEEPNAPEGWFGRFEEELESDEKWAYHKSVEQKLAQRGLAFVTLAEAVRRTGIRNSRTSHI